VRAEAAISRETPVYLDEIGRCTARELVKVQPQVTGPILTRHFQEGADVKKDELLYSIDPRPFEADAARAEAAVVQSRALLDWAELELKRVESVLKSDQAGAIRKQEYDQKKNDVNVAKARLAASEADLTLAKLRLGYCSIRSPIGGRAGERLVDAGNIVKAEETILVVIQRVDPIDVDFTVTERELGRVRARAGAGRLRVEVRVPGDAGEAVAGDLTFIDSAVQGASGTVKLRATLENPARRLWPGQFVNARLILDTLPGAVLVPTAALQTNQEGPFVYVVESDGTAALRRVKLGQRHGGLVVVESGVDGGEAVVVDGQLGVVPGGKVRVLDGAAKSTAAPPRVAESTAAPLRVAESTAAPLRVASQPRRP
jgi:multidrug efflux system membrane fusion protein